MTELLAKLAMFVPRIILAVMILAFGAYFAVFVEGSLVAYLRSIGMDEAPLLGRLTRYGVLLFVVLIAVDQLNIGGDIIRQSFLIVLAGIVFALALAFGLGGQHWAARMLDRWLPPTPDNESESTPKP